MNSFHVRLGTFNLFDETLLYLVATGFGWFFLVGVCLVLARLNYIDLLVLAMFDTVDSL